MYWQLKIDYPHRARWYESADKQSLRDFMDEIAWDLRHDSVDYFPVEDLFWGSSVVSATGLMEMENWLNDQIKCYRGGISGNHRIHRDFAKI